MATLIIAHLIKSLKVCAYKMPPENAATVRGDERRPSGLAVIMWMWRLWKWLVRLLTRKCEIQRLAESKVSLEKRTIQIGNSTKDLSCK